MENSFLKNTQGMNLKVENISKKVTLMESTLTILEDVSFKLDAGESLAITGSSGSGKSTLLGLLAGLDSPSSGKIFMDGECISEMNEDQRAIFRGLSIGFVFQSFQLLPGLTALENVMLPLEILGNESPKSKSLDILDRVGLSHRLKHFPRQLSGGEQQRVAIARAFVNQPKMMFADEPTGNLDKNTGNLIESLLFQLNQEQGATLVLVTHDLGLAAKCQKQLLLETDSLEK